MKELEFTGPITGATGGSGFRTNIATFSAYDGQLIQTLTKVINFHLTEIADIPQNLL